MKSRARNRENYNIWHKEDRIRRKEDDRCSNCSNKRGKFVRCFRCRLLMAAAQRAYRKRIHESTNTLQY